MWLLVLAVSAAACFTPSKQRPQLHKRIFLILLTVFVGQSLYLSSLQRNSSRAEPALDIDNAELVCKLDTAVDYFYGSLLGRQRGKDSVPQIKQLSKFEHSDFLGDAVKLLERRIEKNPDSVLTQAKLAVVLAEKETKQDKHQLSVLVKTLLARKDTLPRQVGEVLQAIYLRRAVGPRQAHDYAAVLAKFYPPGWYRESALIRLYEVSGQSKLLESMKSNRLDSCLGLLLNMLKLILIVAICGFLGLVVIAIQLFTLPRKLGKPEDEQSGSEAPVWDFTTVYGIFVGWLATQIIISSLMHLLVKSTGLLSHGPFLASITTACVYLVCNAPGLLYIYFFACRPNKVKFAPAVWLKLNSGNLGPIRLVLAGFCAWCAALPIVILASYVAMKYFGAQGSSNPVLTLVLDAARSSDWRATTIFYLTLGVLAPICEETLFRGFLYRSLRKRLGVGTSLLASAAAFAAVHLDSGAVIQLFCLGYVFGFVFERTRSLIPAMVAHGLWNSGTFTLVLMILGS